MGRIRRGNRSEKGIAIIAAKRVIGPEIATPKVVERKARDLNRKGRAKVKTRAKERRQRRIKIRRPLPQKTVARAVTVRKRRNQRTKRHG